MEFGVQKVLGESVVGVWEDDNTRKMGLMLWVLAKKFKKLSKNFLK